MTEPLSPTSPPEPVAGDTKDWTWVLERPCPQCGVDAGSLAPESLPSVIRENAPEPAGDAAVGGMDREQLESLGYLTK